MAAILFLGTIPSLVLPAAGQIVCTRMDSTTGRRVLSLWSLNPDGTGAVPIPVAVPEPGYPALSRDGQRVALTSADPMLGFTLSRNVYVCDLRNGGIARITSYANLWDSAKTNQNGTTIDYAGASYVLPWYKAFSPDGQKLAVSADEVAGAHYTSSSDTGGDPATLTTGFTTTPTLKVYTLDGTLLALVDAASASGFTIHAGDGVDWSPQADLLAWPKDIQLRSNLGNPLPATAVFLMAPVGNAAAAGRARQLTRPQVSQGFTWNGAFSTTQADYAPAFSPDGNQVAYFRVSYSFVGAYLPTEEHTLRIIGVDGTNDREVLSLPSGAYSAHVVWSPDGASLAFDRGQQLISSTGWGLMMATPESSEIYTVKPDGSSLTKIAGPGAAWPAWSTMKTAPAAPRLQVGLAKDAGKIRLSWPAAANYRLESTATPWTPASWQPEPADLIVAKQTTTVTLPIKDQARFFRLAVP